MRWWDFVAAYLHEHLWGWGHRILCSIGLHWWSYLGEAHDWAFGARDVWRCIYCHTEKWLRLVPPPNDYSSWGNKDE